MEERNGIVLQGINNIYLVRADDARTYQCRIKGKTLSVSENEYNPLAPGDAVTIQIHDDGHGLVVARLERSNSFVRWNAKRDLPQTIAANVDDLYCVTSTRFPSFRPRFIDRVCVCAKEIPVTILVNKWDLGADEEVVNYLAQYRAVGYEVLEVSAFDTEQMKRLKNRMKGKVVVFFGQSGVGKSTLINKLIPEANQRTGEISDRYDRGRHTTNFAKWIEDDEAVIIDTPGVREIEIPIMDPYEIGLYFPEISRLQDGCKYSPCMHIEEPDCAVRDAVRNGLVTKERYESYAKLVRAMVERRRQLFYGV